MSKTYLNAKLPCIKSLCLLLILSIFSIKTFAEIAEHSATPLFLRGDVQFSTDKKNFNTVKNKDFFTQGDIIKTGDNSLAIIRFPDKSILRIDPNSIVEIEKVVIRIENSSLDSTDLVLKAGRVIIDIINNALSPVFNIRTQAVAVGVRGTRFMMAIDSKSGTTDLAVNRGEVELRHLTNPNLADSIEADYSIHLDAGEKFNQPQQHEWIKKFNFDVNDKKLDLNKMQEVLSLKREEHSRKKMKWSRDQTKWSRKKKLWKRRAQNHLKRSKSLSRKRIEFLKKRRGFLKKRMRTKKIKKNQINKVRQRLKRRQKN